MVCSNLKNKNWLILCLSKRLTEERLCTVVRRTLIYNASPIPDSHPGAAFSELYNVSPFNSPGLICFLICKVRKTEQIPSNVSFLKLYDFSTCLIPSTWTPPFQFKIFIQCHIAFIVELKLRKGSHKVYFCLNYNCWLNKEYTCQKGFLVVNWDQICNQSLAAIVYRGPLKHAAF